MKVTSLALRWGSKNTTEGIIFRAGGNFPLPLTRHIIPPGETSTFAFRPQTAKYLHTYTCLVKFTVLFALHDLRSISTGHEILTSFPRIPTKKFTKICILYKLHPEKPAFVIPERKQKYNRNNPQLIGRERKLLEQPYRSKNNSLLSRKPFIT